MRTRRYRRYISDDVDGWATEDHPRAALVSNLYGQAVPAGVFRSASRVYRAVPASLDERVECADRPTSPSRVPELLARLRTELEAAPNVTPKLVRTAFLFIQSAEKSVREIADDERVSPAAIECRRHALERHYPKFKKAWKERKYHVHRRPHK
jgi:hypothetical protein